MRKLKILRVNFYYPPPWNGLPAAYVLSKEQAKTEDVTVITKEGAIDTPGVRMIRISAKRRMIFAVKALFKFFSMRERFDVLHFHGLEIIPFGICRKLGLIRQPLFLSVHMLRKVQAKKFRCADIYSLKEQVLEKSLVNYRKIVLKHSSCVGLKYWMQAFSLSLADILFPVSNVFRNNLIEDYGIRRKKVILPYNGVDTVAFSDRDCSILRKKLGLEDRKILLTVGRLTGAKGVDALLMAASKLKDIDLCVIVIGNGFCKGVLEQMAKKLKVDVLFIDSVPYDQMVYYYSMADVFVFLTHYEGLAKALIEAMSCSSPIVCTDIPENMELVKDGENGYLVNVNAPDEAAEKIRFLLENEEIAEKMGKRSREIILEKFTWKKVAERCRKAYLKKLRN